MRSAHARIRASGRVIRGLGAALAADRSDVELLLLAAARTPTPRDVGWAQCGAIFFERVLAIAADHPGRIII
jgi:hypothetical protein